MYCLIYSASKAKILYGSPDAELVQGYVAEDSGYLGLFFPTTIHQGNRRAS